MSNEEKKDIEDKINDAMAKIVSDTVGDVQPEKKSDSSASHVTAENSKSAGHSKSARPSNVSHARSARPSGGSGTSRSGRPSGNGTVTSKSARPKKISYVPIDESEFAPIVLPKKKKHKALRVTGMIAAMVLVAAGCAYAGVSYYYTNHFFEGTTINGIKGYDSNGYVDISQYFGLESEIRNAIDYLDCKDKPYRVEMMNTKIVDETTFII